MTKTRLVLLLSISYFGLAILANWLASKWVVPVGFGYVAPAGVFAIGAVLVLRDWLQQISTHLAVAMIPFAAGASYLVAKLAGWTALEKIALASLVAFLVSESVEALVFAPIRRRNLSLGVALSGTAGIVLDSWIFLAVAFGSQAFFAGQMIGKGEALAVGVLLTAARRVVAPVPAAA